LVASSDHGQTLLFVASCMEAFLGIKPKGLWTLGLGVDDLHDDDQSAPVATTQVTDNRELIAKALIATAMGKRYVSKSRAAEMGHLIHGGPDRVPVQPGDLSPADPGGARRARTGP